jgi:WD40 repeat protein
MIGKARILTLLAAGILALIGLGRFSPAADEKPVAKEPLPEGAIARLGTLRWRHSSPVTFVAFTADGKGVVTASQDGILRQWDRASGTELRRFIRGPVKENPAAPKPGDAAQVQAIEAQKALDALMRRMNGWGGMGGTSAAASADGKVLAATVGTDVVLWETATGKEVCSIKAPPAGVSLTFSPNGKTLALRSGDATTILYETATGKELRQIKVKRQDNLQLTAFIGAGGNSPCLAFSPSGKTLAWSEAEFDQQSVTVWLRIVEAETGKDVRRIKLDQTGVCTVAYSPDGKVLAYSSGTTLYLEDAESGKELHKLEGNKGFVGALVFAPDGKTLASKGFGDGMIRLWNVETGKELHQINEAKAVPGGNFAFFVRRGATASLDLAFAPDGKTLATGLEHTVCFYDVATGKEVVQGTGHRGPVTAVVVAADGKTLLSRGSDNTICRWDATTGKELSRIQAPGDVTGTALCPDGSTIALGHLDTTITLHDATTGKELHKLTGHPNGVGQLAFSPDGKTLASRGTIDNLIRLYDVKTGADLKRITQQAEGNAGAGRPVPVKPGRFYGAVGGHSLVFSPDGKVLVSPNPDNFGVRFGGAGAGAPPAQRAALCLFDVATGKEIRKILLPDQQVVSVAFSPDGRSLAAENPNSTITVWETASGKERGQLGKPLVIEAQPGGFPVMMVGMPYGGGTAGAAASVAFASDGRKVAVRAGNGVRVWDALTGKELAHFKGHEGPVTALAFSADGKVLASGSNDTTILLWNTGNLNPERPAGAKLSEQEVEAYWSDLSGADAAKAYKGIQALASAPVEASAFLKRQLHPVVPVAPNVLDQLIKDLQSEKLSVRKKAADELDKLGALAVPALSAVLTNDPPLDLRKRVEEILEKLTGGPLVGEQIRTVRAVEVLELAGTPDARALLQTLARGAPGALPTREAQAALDRLNR